VAAMPDSRLDLNSPVLYRLTCAGLDWYLKNRVLNRQRTSSQKYARNIWEIALGRLCSGSANGHDIYSAFIVGSPVFEKREVAEQLGLLLELGYLSTRPAPELDAIGRQHLIGEARIAQQCGRDWSRRAELMRGWDAQTMAKLKKWFAANEPG
jgi:hypothetical protein